MSNKTGDMFLKDIFSRYLSNSLANLRISSSFEFLLMSKALPSTGAELVSQSFSLWSQKLLKSRLKKIKNAQWAYNKSSYKLAHIIKDLILYIEVLFWLFLSWFFPFTFLFLSLSFLFLPFLSFSFLSFPFWSWFEITSSILLRQNLAQGHLDTALITWESPAVLLISSLSLFSPQATCSLWISDRFTSWPQLCMHLSLKESLKNPASGIFGFSKI